MIQKQLYTVVIGIGIFLTGWGGGTMIWAHISLVPSGEGTPKLKFELVPRSFFLLLQDISLTP